MTELAENYKLSVQRDEFDDLFLCHSASNGYPMPIDTLIAVGVDVCGLISLCVKKDRAYLSKLGNFSLDPKKDWKVRDEDGKSYPLEFDPDDEKRLWIKKSGVRLGDIFTLVDGIVLKEKSLCGVFAERFACIRILMELASIENSGRFTFCFYTGSESRAPRLSNIARRLRPKQIVILSPLESSVSSPTVAIREGKAFSDESLLDSARNCQSRLEFPIRFSVLEENKTKSDLICATEAIPFISIFLPFERKDGLVGEISLSSYDNCKLFLQDFLKELNQALPMQ